MEMEYSPNDDSKVRRKKNLQDRKREKLRDALWPGSSKWIWDAFDMRVMGFTSVPRVLPWVLHAIKSLSKGSDPSSAYLELWCRDYGLGIVEISDDQECAFAAGYASTRAIRTWREHMQKLVDLGFILCLPSGNREFGHVLLLNPLAVCHRLKLENKLPEGWWPSFVARANAIGATIPEPLDLKQTSENHLG